MADAITYIRFEEGSGLLASDGTGLMNGELNNFPDTSPGAGDTGIGWSTSVPSPTVPLTGQSNTGSLRMGPIAYVDLSNGNDLSLGTEFTVEAFIKPDPFSVAPVFGFGPSSDLYMLIAEDEDGTLGYQFEFQNQFFFGPVNGLQIGVWQHIALVKQPEEYSLYLDGALVAQDSLPASTDGPYFFPGSDETGDRTIGGESGTFYGWIDEFRISDTALTPDQFLGAFPIPEPSTSLLAMWGLSLAALALRDRGRV